jgi:hypothetical protein
MPDPKDYALAVHEDGRLLLAYVVRRAPKGDVYCNWPQNWPPKDPDWPSNPSWQPHASYHASGEFHHKSHNRARLRRQVQEPDENFAGVVEVISTNVPAAWARAINKPCDSTQFSEVVEVDAADLKVGPGRVPHLWVDLAAAGCLPVVPTDMRVIRQQVFSDATPHIVITVLDGLGMYPGESDVPPHH